MDAATLLQTITLAVAGWVLIELIGIKTKIAIISQKLKDLPCDDCSSQLANWAVKKKDEASPLLT